MRFSYREYVSQFPGSDDFRLILRPVITIRIIGAASDARWDALLDTGADETLLPMSLASLLGVSLDKEAPSEAIGVSGDKLTIHYGEVDLELAEAGEIIRWKTIAGFVEFGSAHEELIVLGHGGCLDYFTAKFDGEAAEVELQPNDFLPHS